MFVAIRINEVRPLVLTMVSFYYLLFDATEFSFKEIKNNKSRWTHSKRKRQKDMESVFFYNLENTIERVDS